MISIRRGLRILSFLTTTVFLLPAQETKPLSAMPDAGFPLSGAWDCEGTFRGGKLHKAAFTSATILDGKWLELSEQDIEPATGYVAKYLIGYDSQQKHLVEFDANNFGAALYTSELGWQAGVLTMTSATSQDASAPYVANRFIYSVQPTGSFTVEWQVQKSVKSDWATADHLACKTRAPVHETNQLRPSK